MASLLTKVKTRMSIYAHRKVQGLLDGEYGSVFKGRSMDFDDLRQYIPGDDIKDIDWKATARSGQTLIKRYVAIRKHNILLVVDSGRNMAATGATGEVKRSIAVMAAGVLGYIVQKHGDLIALVAGDSVKTHYLPLKATDIHLEQILRRIDAGGQLTSPVSNLSSQLEYITHHIRRHMMLIIIADDMAIGEADEHLIRRLAVQHEIMWLTVGDATITDKKYEADDMYDVATDLSIPRFLRRNSELSKEFSVATARRRAETQHLLERLKIASERVTGEADVVMGIFRLLEKQRHARY